MRFVFLSLGIEGVDYLLSIYDSQQYLDDSIVK